MAQNLRAKIPSGDTLVIHDRNTEATTKFMQEAGGTSNEEMGIEVASSPRQVAEKSVSTSPITSVNEVLVMSISTYDLSWELALCRSFHDSILCLL